MSRIRIRNARCPVMDDLPDRGRVDMLDFRIADVEFSPDGIESVTFRSQNDSASVNHGDETVRVSQERVDQEIDADGKVLMPAFVDCHTHACWAGNRQGEWTERLRGASYLELLAKGGGIMSTVRAVRQASRQELTVLLLERLWRMLRHGTTVAEVKSGYGLTLKDELKMLQAIRDAADHWVGQIVPVACIGHALDPEVPRERYVDQVIRKTLPAVTAEFPGIAIDAYCESGAWSVDECRQLFDAAREAGHPVRVHADQFHSLGMVDVAVQQQYRSVDHLESTTKTDLQRLAASDTWGVMLPVCGVHLDGRFANGRSFLDFGGRLAIATNCNPGSAPCVSMQFVIATAVRNNGLTLPEAILASTWNPARLLGLKKQGSLGPGNRADLVLLDIGDERDLAFELGGNLVKRVFVNGRES